MRYSFSDNKGVFLEGIRAGLPIGAGYFAVSFALGIAAKQAGLTAAQGFLVSFFCNASAGEYAAFSTMAARAGVIELVLVLLVANARYLLMSSAMSQRLDPNLPIIHRMLIAYDVTDELFGIAIARPGYLNPYYTYGAMVSTIPAWALGTALGVTAGNLLPLRLVSALGVALYGMFLACIIPEARKNKVVSGVIAVSFLASYLTASLPMLSEISSGTKTILLTVLIAGGAAVLFPRTEEAGAPKRRKLRTNALTQEG